VARGRRLAVLLLVAGTIGLAACGGGDDTEVRGRNLTRPPLTAAPGLVVDDPDVPPAAGDLVAAHPLGRDVVPTGANGWEIVYRSTGARGDLVEVTGVVYAPDSPSPEGGRPVFSWAHGPVGTADRCAPTRNGVDVPYAESLIRAGFVVVATDYEGLGTPGPHPFLVGSSAGHSVLDIVRAAERLDVAGAGSRFVAAGHFQGGHAALFAGTQVDEYAPELDLLGILTGVPAAETEVVIGGMAGVPSLFGHFAMAASGYVATYDDLTLDDLFTAEAVERLSVLESDCAPEILAEFADTPPAELVVRGPFESKPWVARMAENQVPHEAIDAPMLILHGLADEVIPIEITDAFVGRLCDAGRMLQYRRVRGAGHDDLYESEEALVFGWLDARLNREPATSTCGAG
jgi:acetyl esterase/lipase